MSDRGPIEDLLAGYAVGAATAVERREVETAIAADPAGQGQVP